MVIPLTLMNSRGNLTLIHIIPNGHMIGMFVVNEAYHMQWLGTWSFHYKLILFNIREVHCIN